MRNLGRAAAAFTIWTAAAASFAQTPSTPSTAPATQSAVDAPPEGESITVAPMAVAQVSVAPAAPAPAPTPPVAMIPAGPPPMVGIPEAVYVTDFVAVPADAPPSGMLARLRTALHTRAAGHDAGLVAQAVVQRLNNMGVAARYLASGEQPPVQGWLIGGVFHVQGAAGAAADSAAPGPEALGTNMSITVADLEHSADTPFAVIGALPEGTGAVGEGKWHPVVVPAKLAFERADRNAAVAALARQIADTFVGNMTTLRQADAKAISP